MKKLIVGGNFGDTPKKSSVVEKLGYALNSMVINGGELVDLPLQLSSDLIIWMPNISNETAKQYPKKSVGNVLICSKVMREGYREVEAVSRIFKMRGNAVIAIYPGEKFTFKLIDALGNIWYSGTLISELAMKIVEFYEFTKSAVRYKSSRINVDEVFNLSYKQQHQELLSKLIILNQTLSNHIQTSCGERFFGNLSTRCSKLFPSRRYNSGILVSPRNVNKDNITANDMVYCEYDDFGGIHYIGNHKPSVDTPIQLNIYIDCPDINFMIHGHAFIKDAEKTSEYFLCGDVRETNGVINIIKKNKLPYGSLNLKNHGFLIYADSLENLADVIYNSEFNYEREDLL